MTTDAKNTFTSTGQLAALLSTTPNGIYRLAESLGLRPAMTLNETRYWSESDAQRLVDAGKQPKPEARGKRK
jgi:hypothetical protein